MEQNYREEKQIRQIPQDYKEFRYSKIYILPSHLKKGQGILPEAMPLEQTYKDENIYLRKYVCDLLSKGAWRRKMRRVRAGEESVKKVLTMTGQGEQLIDLYGMWQTDEFENKIGEDGKLPKNEYGNYELFNGDIPEGAVHIDLPGLPRICKKLGLEFVEAVVDFETGKNGRPHIVKGGIIAHERDKKVIREAYIEYQEEIEKKEMQKQEKEVVGLWKGVLRKILVKKYIQDTYALEQEI